MSVIALKTLWIGIRSEDLRYSLEQGPLAVENLRNGKLVRYRTTTLQVIRNGNVELGFGLVCALIGREDFTWKSEEVQSSIEQVRIALNIRGVSGRITVNLEVTDAPRLPTRMVR